MERILTAAEQLLEERDFADLTMAELARRAGCAVGTLYGRLPNKVSLLVCLQERHLSTGIAESEAVFAACSTGSLDARVAALCRMIVEYVAAHRGVGRAITEHLLARSGAEVADFKRQVTKAFRQAAAVLAEKVDRRVHPDPQRACEFAVLTASEMAQSRLVFAERTAAQLRYSRKELEARITAMITAYLRHGARKS